MAKSKKGKKTEDQKTVKDEVLVEAGKATKTNTQDQKISKESPKKSSKEEVKKSPKESPKESKKKGNKDDKKKKKPKEEDSDSDSDLDSDSEESEAKKKINKKKKNEKKKVESTKKNSKQQKSDSSESESDSDSDSEDDDSDSEDEPKKNKNVEKDQKNKMNTNKTKLESPTKNGQEKEKKDDDSFIKLDGSDQKKRKNENEENSANKFAKQKHIGEASKIELYIGNVSFTASDVELRQMFESYGEITRLDWKNDKDTGKFMGYGYLSFTTDEAAEKVIAELNGKVIAGRPLRIDYSSGTRAGAGAGGRGGGGGSGGDFGGGRSRERSSPAETIFVGNLPTDVTGDEISETFGNCGNIVDIRYVNDRETGEFKRCAFVEFEDEASAARVFEDSRSIRDCSLRLDYASKKPSSGGFGGGGGGGGRGGGGGGRGGRKGRW